MGLAFSRLMQAITSGGGGSSVPGNIFVFAPTPAAVPYYDESLKTQVAAAFACWRLWASYTGPLYKMKQFDQLDSAAIDYYPENYAAQAALILNTPWTILGEYDQSENAAPYPNNYVAYGAGTAASPLPATFTNGRIAEICQRTGYIYAKTISATLRLTAAQRALFGSKTGLMNVQVLGGVQGNSPNAGIPLMDVNNETSTAGMQWERTRYQTGAFQIETNAHDPVTPATETPVNGVSPISTITGILMWASKVSPPDRFEALYRDGLDTPDASNSAIWSQARAGYPASAAYSAAVFASTAAPIGRDMISYESVFFLSAFMGSLDDAILARQRTIKPLFDRQRTFMRDATQSRDNNNPINWSDGTSVYSPAVSRAGNSYIQRYDIATKDYRERSYIDGLPADDHNQGAATGTPLASLIAAATGHDSADTTKFCRWAGKDIKLAPLVWTHTTSAIPGSNDGIIPAFGASSKTAAYNQFLLYGSDIYWQHRVNQKAWVIHKIINDGVNGLADMSAQMCIIVATVKYYAMSRIDGNEMVMFFWEHAATVIDNRLRIAVVNMLTGDIRSNGNLLGNIVNGTGLPLQPNMVSPFPLAVFASGPANGIVDPEDMSDDGNMVLYARGATSFGSTTEFTLGIYISGDRSVPSNWKRVKISGGIGTNQRTPKDGFKFHRYAGQPAGINIICNRHDIDGVTGTGESWNATPAAVAAVADGGTLAFTRTVDYTNSTRQVYKLTSITGATKEAAYMLASGYEASQQDISTDYLPIVAT